MKITFAQYGGWTAGLRLQPKTVDSSTLPKEEAAKLAPLVSAAKAGCKGLEGAGQARDAVAYKVTIDGDGETTVLRASDANMPPGLSDLIDWIKRQKAGH